MKINQLFNMVVRIEVVDAVCRCMGLAGVDDGRCFTRGELQRRGAADRVKAMPEYEELKACYIPCKRRLYIEPFETSASEQTKNVYKTPEHMLLVILRQLLRLHGRRLVPTEHSYGANRKVIRYRIEAVDGPSSLQVSTGSFQVAMS